MEVKTAYLFPFLEGCGTGAGLIIAIGAQNAFVLKQGILKNQVFATALFCAITDALLITIGVAGFGELLTLNPILLVIAKWGGAAFLFYYGLRAFRSVFSNHSLKSGLPYRLEGGSSSFRLEAD